MVIYKYKLTDAARQHVTVPRGSWVKDVQIQDGVLCVWVYVPDPDTKETDEMVVRCVGTGEHFEINDVIAYTTTVQDNAYVWHIFVFVL